MKRGRVYVLAMSSTLWVSMMGGSEYSFEDPSQDHTQQGIAMEERLGSHSESVLKAFQSAVRHQPSAVTVLNLGVFHMRRNDLVNAQKHLIEARALANDSFIREIADANLQVIRASMHGECLTNIPYRTHSVLLSFLTVLIPASIRYCPRSDRTVFVIMTAQLRPS